MRGLFVVAIALALTSVSGLKTNGPAPAPGPAPGPAPTAGDMCRELCKKDTGMDADFSDCMTECNVYTDTSSNFEDAGQKFVEDESANEAGGEEMAEKFENMTDREVPRCHPTVDASHEPSFGELDENEDGKVTLQEAIDWGNEACIPDEMIRQLFSDTDGNRDGVVDTAEWGVSGEDTDLEKKIDQAADKKTEGDDEYQEVQLPAFETFDLNDDGKLEESEVFDAFMFEMRQRMPEMDEDKKQEVISQFREEVTKEFKILDKNEDGVLDKSEYYSQAQGGDMGDELNEAQNADEDATDPDDMGRDDMLAGGPSPAGASPAPAAASLLAKSMRGMKAVRAHKQIAATTSDMLVPSPILVNLWQDAVTAMGYRTIGGVTPAAE